MDVDFYDTYAKSKQGHTIHFDALVAQGQGRIRLLLMRKNGLLKLVRVHKDWINHAAIFVMRKVILPKFSWGLKL